MSDTKTAHIITSRQKKGALSEIKKKAKTPKNVMVKNFREFWPSLDEKQTEEFTEILKGRVDWNMKTCKDI
jgi:hypothetical protein